MKCLLCSCNMKENIYKIKYWILSANILKASVQKQRNSMKGSKLSAEICSFTGRNINFKQGLGSLVAPDLFINPFLPVSLQM